MDYASIIAGIVTGLLTGVITGIFSGLVTFRYGQYAACKSRLWELVCSFETGTEPKDKDPLVRKQYYDFSSSKEIYHIKGNLEALGHISASEIVKELCQDIENLKVTSPRHALDSEDFRIEHQKLIDKAASIEFSWRALFPCKTYKKGHYPPYSWLYRK